ncbi:bifunctional 2-methylcitrate dehydratase/aconitate hydratase [Dyella sp. LX-66]|uniref:bifunctional 2-methylcitrate dehydratase/aconitate hydratase n=1 Tax=unclassified Dyella TaxID=2634549 RepID=UPI001BE0FB1B|nr:MULTISPECIES: bifunctional 2-methylcitrate dehydratase/aconitate hydratase [unclassified Dyella]MBT2118286.1 bifunctional 2-methylcitrate dehydratase/aconitate hydratase [Dyella sp. LX-1]MBT2138688.1 bifunctional 2-methylcitrate dehydratase/aconitate hydratase [Dyella sp. LX-66]
MSSHDIRSAQRPSPDQAMVDIADYVLDYRIESAEAYDTARYMLLDSLATAMLAMKFPECVKHLGPVVPGAVLPGGARVPGTSYELDPVQAAFAIGTQIRWLDFNDTWLAAEWGHPSDNLGAILAVADYLGRKAQREGGTAPTVREVLGWAIKAHEIQGCYALLNSFNRVGQDHVILVRLASTAVAAAMLGGSREQIVTAVSHSWIDNGALRTYRHAPNTGPRKSWAAGDACRRAVIHAINAVYRGVVGYPSALSAATWGYYDVAFKGNPFRFERPFGSYVMENVLFKLSYPAEFHAQTAVECAMQLHPQVAGRIDEIDQVAIETQEAGARIIDKTGPLANYADRDHCIQYMVAVPLIFGRLTAEDYSDEVAADPRIDALRARMAVSENPRFTRDYYDPDKRFIGNSVQVFFKDGSSTEKVTVDYPIGHRRRRAEGIPVLLGKFEAAMRGHLPGHKVGAILHAIADPSRLDAMPVQEFLELFTL